MDSSDPLYVFGPTGSGKTSAIKQLAARLNYPVFDVTGHGRLEFPDLVGHLSVRDGSMEFQYGPLALAMLHGGILLLNEIDLLEPATATGFNGILDGEPLCIPRMWRDHQPPPMFRFAATANTNGGSTTRDSIRAPYARTCVPCSDSAVQMPNPPRKRDGVAGTKGTDEPDDIMTRWWTTPLSQASFHGESGNNLCHSIESPSRPERWYAGLIYRFAFNSRSPRIHRLPMP
jgi:cobaltochelatase CobS